MHDPTTTTATNTRVPTIRTTSEPIDPVVPVARPSRSKLTGYDINRHAGRAGTLCPHGQKGIRMSNDSARALIGRSGMIGLADGSPVEQSVWTPSPLRWSPACPTIRRGRAERAPG